MGSWTYSGLAGPRRPTRTVRVGNVAVGGSQPIRIQSMTTPSTKDTAATVRQIERLVDAGCEIVRLTVPTTGDAENLPNIRRELERRSIRVPLVADIHFTPAAAMKAIEHVDKIRINPGNYADKKKFAVREYTDSEYSAELDRIAEVFSPLVRRARDLGVSMRIGTNHGSLSDRIMNRYGDTPEGMVESALEFVRICESHGYRDLILSMKSSNPVVVLHVYRLLATRMAAENMDYPFHLGVTEAGDGEDARIKSAIGIGTLLTEGIGDTIRVSLTEDPVAEVPVARALVATCQRPNAPSAAGPDPVVPEVRDPYNYSRRASSEMRVGPGKLGGAHPVWVEVPMASRPGDPGLLREIDAQIGAAVPQEARPELVSVEVQSIDEIDALTALRRSMENVAPGVALSARIPLELLLGERDECDAWLGSAHRLQVAGVTSLTADERSWWRQWLESAERSARTIVVEAGSSRGDVDEAVELALQIAKLSPPDTLLPAIAPLPGVSPLHATRKLAAGLAAAKLDLPVLLLDRPSDRDVDPLLGPSVALGGLLCDGIGDSIQIGRSSAWESRTQAFGILQAARVRITRTEFISCPSCGRTLFELEETTARIKARTAHLKGLKIAVMGCVVNGPGEMADADFGYVGWGEDKIALFVGKEMVARDVPTAEADKRLVELIKLHGKWIDPPVPTPE